MKKTLNMAELDAQTAVELPERELMATINFGGGLINVGVGDVSVDVSNNTVNANVCVALLANNSPVQCENIA